MSVDTGIIQLFLHPPIGLQKVEVINQEPVEGSGSLTRPRLVVPIGNVGVDAFGLFWQIGTVPSGYGIVTAAGKATYDRTVLHLSVVHRLQDGTEVFTQTADINEGQGFLQFTESFPLRVQFTLAPGVPAFFYWLVRLLATP